MTGQTGASDLPAPVWLAENDCTFKEALLVGVEIRRLATEVLPTLGRKDAARHFPATMSDALSLAHAREDAKKKNAINKSAKSKHKSLGQTHAGSGDHFPGATEGGGDASAFWMYLEVGLHLRVACIATLIASNYINQNYIINFICFQFHHCRTFLETLPRKMSMTFFRCCSPRARTQHSLFSLLEAGLV